MHQNSHGILLFSQVGESNGAAAEFAHDNATWLHLVTLENSLTEWNTQILSKWIT